jgi:hypothetical protein
MTEPYIKDFCVQIVGTVYQGLFFYRFGNHYGGGEIFLIVSYCIFSSCAF